MCQKCVDAVKLYYPKLPEKKYGDFLFGTTCFPFGEPERVAEQLATMKRDTDGSVEAAYVYAERTTDMAMAGFELTEIAMTPSEQEADERERNQYTRRDREGRDVTNLPGLWSEEDVEEDGVSG